MRSTLVLRHRELSTRRSFTSECVMNPTSLSFRFEITGDLAVAGYFLMANWPNPRTAPALDASRKRLAIVLDGSPEAVKDLRETLVRGQTCGGLLGASAEAWLRAIERPETRQPDGGCSSAPCAG